MIDRGDYGEIQQSGYVRLDMGLTQPEAVRREPEDKLVECLVNFWRRLHALFSFHMERCIFSFLDPVSFHLKLLNWKAEHQEGNSFYRYLVSEM